MDGELFAKDVTTSRLKDPARARPMSPEELDVPRLEGRSEENSHMVRAALKHFDTHQVGFVKLDENNKKFIYEADALDGK